jgi:antitoxin (DNA-binding transcriptional repressor) of toxin-antitoxin stability system
MRVVNIHSVKTDLPRLLIEVAAGEEIIIAWGQEASACCR